MLPKRKLESEPVTRPFARAGATSPREVEDEQRAIDSFAAILRILGRYAVPQNQMSAEQTNVLCEKWARHILVVGARPSDPDDAKGSERRDWAGVTEFVTKLRRTESETVAEYLASLRETITEFAGGLGSIVSEDGRVEKQLQAQVARLRLSGGEQRPANTQTGSAVRVRGDWHGHRGSQTDAAGGDEGAWRQGA
jgi:hypothetical protein